MQPFGLTNYEKPSNWSMIICDIILHLLVTVQNTGLKLSLGRVLSE